MRDLYKVLKLFDEEDLMDYCEEFDDIKSILQHCNLQGKSFNKIHYRRGNEAHINNLTNRIQQYFIEKKFFDEHTNEPLESAYKILRKITLFLFANTDATYKYNLNDDPTFGHILEVCPLLPKFLLVTIIWIVKLDKFFYEVLSYCPCWFTFQYLEVATDSLKYIDDPYDCLTKVENMIKSIYISISRSEERQIDTIDKKIIFGKLNDCNLNILRQFYTPDAEKFKNFTKNEFFTYSGFAIKHLLQLLLFCFDVYEMPQKVKPEIDLEVYEICTEICRKNVLFDGKLSYLVTEHQLKIINALLNTLQYNVMLVRIDVFMHWVEVDLNETVNLQMAVGEMAYILGERMTANRTFGHDVEKQLKSIAIRPKTLIETVRDATIGEILKNLDEPGLYSVKKVWFDELINRTVALGNDECIQAIKDNIKLISVENCQQIIDYIYKEFKENKQKNKEIQTNDNNDDMNMQSDEDLEECAEIASVILCALSNFNCDQIITLICYEIKKFGEDTTICCQYKDFQERSIEFFNKFSNCFDVQQFLQLCFENPEEMWTKFFDCACNSSEYIINFCSTVQKTRPFSNSYFHSLFSNAMTSSDKIREKFFPQLLCEIYFVLYFTERKREFLKTFINQNVNEMLDNDRFEDLLPIVKALNLICERSETQSHKPLNFGEETAPVLLMSAKIMEKSRWDLITYCDERDEIVRECIKFIQNTSKKFLPLATEKDRKWINKAIKDSHRPITQYYFQKFSLLPEQPQKTLDRFLIPLEIKDKSEAEMFLIINYVRCTMKETEWLARSDRLLPHISDMMLILGGVVTETANPNAVHNYRHCMVNYANIVVKYLLPQAAGDQKKIERLELKILKIIESSPAEIYEEIFMSFDWLLFEVMKLVRTPVEESTIKSIKNFIISMKSCQARDIFLDKFEAFVNESLT